MCVCVYVNIYIYMCIRLTSSAGNVVQAGMLRGGEGLKGVGNFMHLDDLISSFRVSSRYHVVLIHYHRYIIRPV